MDYNMEIKGGMSLKYKTEGTDRLAQMEIGRPQRLVSACGRAREEWKNTFQHGFLPEEIKVSANKQGEGWAKDQLCVDEYFLGVSMISVYFHSNLKTFANLIDYGY